MASKSRSSRAQPTLKLKEALPPTTSIPKYRYHGHEKAIWSCVFLHDNVYIVSGSRDGTMCKWNCDTGLLVGKPWKGDGGDIFALALSPDGKTIACGREDGSVQRWTTGGDIIKGVWVGHSKAVRSLSWSPSGDYLASGSYDGTILIRNADSGNIEVGPIETKQREVLALAYSPSGDRIAPGGLNSTICIWNIKSSKLVVGPIEGLGAYVTSLVWSPDNNKVYSACDTFVRVFDSTSGGLLHRLAYDKYLYSIALSPTNKVLACVGNGGIVQLWDTESNQRLGQSFLQDREALYCVSFSRDGRYIACGGHDGKLTLWTAKDITPVPILQQGRSQGTQQKGQPKSPSSSFLNVDATNPSGGDGIIEEVSNDPYHNFFGSSQVSLPLSSGPPQPPHPSSARRIWNIISRHRPPVNLKSVPQEHSKRGLFTRRTDPNTPTPPTTSKLAQSTPEVKAKAGNEDKESDKDVDLPDVSPVGFQRYVALTHKRKTKSLAMVSGAPLAAPPSGLCPSSQGGSTHATASSQPASGQPVPSPQVVVAAGASSSYTSPSQFVTTHHTSHDSDSDSIQGSCNKFLDKLCFPRGHFHEDT